MNRLSVMGYIGDGGPWAWTLWLVVMVVFVVAVLRHAKGETRVRK